MLREYIYNGESEEELKTRLKNIFGDGCLCERYKYDSVKPPIGTIYVYDEFNYGWVAGKAAFCGWNFMVVGKYEVKSLCCSVEIFFYFYYFFQKKCLVLYFFRHIKYVRKNHYQLIIALENRLYKLHNGISQELESRINTKPFPRVSGVESITIGDTTYTYTFSPRKRG